MSRLMKKKDLQVVLSDLDDEDLEVVFESNSETTAHLVSERVYTSASKSLHSPHLRSIGKNDK